MRLNKYVASATGVSRRKADELITQGRVTANDEPAQLGRDILQGDVVAVDGKVVSLPQSFVYLLINKPNGYVSSRKSQDETPTVYELVPEEYQHLKYVGRLDKNSSGALILTNDGDFAHRMTHPSYVKSKIYSLQITPRLRKEDQKHIENGVELEDGVSKFDILENKGRECVVEMHEGRNRQIRRTFESLGYKVLKLHRTKFGPYALGNLNSGEFIEVKKLEV